MFNVDVGVVVRRVLAKLDAGEAQTLHDAIDASLESFFEDIEVDVEVDSSANCETDSVEPSVNSWRIYDPDQADVISADDELLVFSVPVHADVNFGISFGFSHWDSVDREYVNLGSRTVNVPKEIEVIITISVSREIEPEPEVLEISAARGSITLDLGNVDPFDC